jgi:formamidopyrimidine-DNA glycosylase
VLRTAVPPLDALHGRTVTSIERMGKRIVLGFDDDLFLAIHLMIAGRLRWRDRGVSIPRRVGLAAFDFPQGSVLFTEASTQQRASLHVLRGEAALQVLNAGGLEPLGASIEAFARPLRRENHTLKRTLTDPRLFSGIGNSYSDEILHRARLSPLLLTSRMTDAQIAALHAATQSVLVEWTDRLRAETGDDFPEKVTAFREGMAVHGRFKQPCPDCGAPVQRIVYAENETNYCARCQTGGKLLADRAFSRLLRDDWPRTLEELEEGRLAAGINAPLPAADRASAPARRPRSTTTASSAGTRSGARRRPTGLPQARNPAAPAPAPSRPRGRAKAGPRGGGAGGSG